MRDKEEEKQEHGERRAALIYVYLNSIHTYTHNNDRYIIDGNKVIILREDVDQKVDDATFEQGEVYSVDVAFSSGEGRFTILCVFTYMCFCVWRSLMCSWILMLMWVWMWMCHCSCRLHLPVLVYRVCIVYRGSFWRLSCLSLYGWASKRMSFLRLP